MKITFSAGFKNYSTKDRWAYSKLCRSWYADVLCRMTVCALTCPVSWYSNCVCKQRATWSLCSSFSCSSVSQRKSNNVCEERVTCYIMLCFSYSLPKQAHLATLWLPLPARNGVCGLQEIRRNEGAGTGKINKRTQRGRKLFKALVAVHVNKQVQEVKGGSLHFIS